DAVSRLPRPTRTDAQTIASSPTIRDYRDSASVAVDKQWLSESTQIASDPVYRKRQVRASSTSWSLDSPSEASSGASRRIDRPASTSRPPTESGSSGRSRRREIEVESEHSQSLDLRSEKGPGTRGRLPHDRPCRVSARTSSARSPDGTSFRLQSAAASAQLGTQL